MNVTSADGDRLIRRDSTFLWRCIAAGLGLLIVLSFAYQLDMAPHLDRTFGFFAMAAILAIGIVGAGAVIQHSDDSDEDERRCPHCGEPLD